MQVAVLLFYLSSDKRQRRCFFCQIAAAALLFKQLVPSPDYLITEIIIYNDIGNAKGVQTFHHLPFIHPTVNHGHLINGLGLGFGLGLGLALDMRSHRRLITVKFYHRDT